MHMFDSLPWFQTYSLLWFQRVITRTSTCTVVIFIGSSCKLCTYHQLPEQSQAVRCQPPVNQVSQRQLEVINTLTLTNHAAATSCQCQANFTVEQLTFTKSQLMLYTCTYVSLYPQKATLSPSFCTLTWILHNYCTTIAMDMVKYFVLMHVL